MSAQSSTAAHPRDCGDVDKGAGSLLAPRWGLAQPCQHGTAVPSPSSTGCLRVPGIHAAAGGAQLYTCPPPSRPLPKARNDATRLIPVPAAVLHDPSCASPQHWGNGSGQQLWDIQRALSIPQQPPAQLSTPSQQELCSSTRRLPFA